MRRTITYLLVLGECGRGPVVPAQPEPIAPVVTPLDWEEVNDSKLGAQTYHIKNILKRVAQKNDPWRYVHQHAESLNRARERLDEMLEAEGQPSYSRRRLRRWADWMREAAAEGHDVYAYFNNDRNAYAVRNAQTLRELFGPS
jgi:uncharacterized protein YecE (DUF72 family)